MLLDGVCFRDPKTGVLVFHPAPAPSQEEIEVLVSVIAERVERWLKRKGFGRDEEDVPVEEDEDDAQVLLMAASMEGRSALGRRSGRKTRRMGVPRGPSELPPRCAAINGYNLHADVCVSAKDRIGLERLCRYLLRPALSKTRLEEKEDGTIVLRLKRPWSDGTTEIVLSRLEFLERICALIPPPKSHTVAYHGILAGNAAWRPEVVPRDPPRPRPTKAVFKLIRVEDAPAERLREVTTASGSGWRSPDCATTGQPATAALLTLGARLRAAARKRVVRSGVRTRRRSGLGREAVATSGVSVPSSSVPSSWEVDARWRLWASNSANARGRSSSVPQTIST